MDQPHVLVLDDDVDVLREIVENLSFSCHVIGASSRDEAQNRLDAQPAGAGFTVLVLDMWLGAEQEGGLEFARRARNSALRPEIVFLTGHGSVENAARTMEVTPSDYVQKGRPDTYSRLEDAVLRAHRRWIEKTLQGLD